MRRMRNRLLLSPAIIIIIITIIIIVLVVSVAVVDDDTYCWVYLSSDHPFQVYFKVRQNRGFGQQISKTVFKLFKVGYSLFIFGVGRAGSKLVKRSRVGG